MAGSARIAASPRRVVADQVAHLDALRGERGVAQRQAADRADVVLELAGDRALDRPVARVVHPRGHLVEHRAVGGGEELAASARRHSRAPRRPAPASARASATCACDRGRGRHGRAGEDAALVDVLGRVPEAHVAVARRAPGSPRTRPRTAPALRRPARCCGRSSASASRADGDPPLALAVVAVAAGLEDAGRADRARSRAARSSRRYRPARRARGGRRGLRRSASRFSRSCAVSSARGCGSERHVAERRQRRDRHVLELVGDHAQSRGEAGQRLRRRATAAQVKRGADFGGDAVALRARRRGSDSRAAPRPSPASGRAGRRRGCRWCSPGRDHRRSGRPFGDARRSARRGRP